MRDEDLGLVIDQGLDAGPQLRAQVGIGGHDRHHVDGAFERGVAGCLTERGDGVAAREVVERLGDAGARLFDLGVRLGARRAPEQVAVEADVDVVVVDGDAVMPQPVSHCGEPARLQLVGAPQLVERSVDEDDAGHGRRSTR